MLHVPTDNRNQLSKGGHLPCWKYAPRLSFSPPQSLESDPESLLASVDVKSKPKTFKLCLGKFSVSNFLLVSMILWTGCFLSFFGYNSFRNAPIAPETASKLPGSHLKLFRNSDSSSFSSFCFHLWNFLFFSKCANAVFFKNPASEGAAETDSWAWFRLPTVWGKNVSWYLDRKWPCNFSVIFAEAKSGLDLGKNGNLPPFEEKNSRTASNWLFR